MDRQSIIDALGNEFVTLEGLSSRLSCGKEEVSDVLRKLEFGGFVMHMPDGRYRNIGNDIVLAFVKTRIKDVAYVTPYKKDMRDIRLVGLDARGLLRGDLVYVKIDDMYNDNGEGILISILRQSTHIEGLVKKVGNDFCVDAYKHIESNVRFVVESSKVELKEGQLVRAEIAKRDDKEFSVHVTDIICNVGNRMYELTKAILEKGGLVTYPRDVQEQAFSYQEYVDDCLDRKDLTNLCVVTIDGASTKDFDDGLSIERTEAGYDVGVHIADVASYVGEGSPLDYEARDRATSMYFPETEVSMLPQLLSDDICSLNPYVDKLTITCLLHLDYNGALISSEVFLSKVRSKARLTYDQVDGYIAKESDTIPDDVKDTVDLLIECSKKILDEKKRRGLLNFGRNYPEFTLDENGVPDSVKPRHESEAENLVEVFMILANNEVGDVLNKHGVPVLYRTEDAPDYEDMILVRDFLYRFDIDPRLFPLTITSENLANYFKAIPDWAQTIGKLCTLKLMKPVAYSTKPSLHFGLNCTHYVYFTSPIRRYPDLLSHRLIHDFLLNDDMQNDKSLIEEYLDNITSILSQEEKIAKSIMNNAHDMECERFMETRGTEVFDAEVKNFIGGGIKVSLTNGISGLIPYDRIDGDVYKGRKMCFSIFGRNTEREIVLGDRLEVMLADIVPETHALIFETVDYLDSLE